MPAFNTGYYLVGGTKVYVAVGGDGPPLLMLPTVTMTHAHWSILRPHLESRLRLIMPDPLGGGRSDKPERQERYAIEEQANLMLSLLDTLGIREAHVMGAAFGGATALALAGKARQRIRSAVVIEGFFTSARLPTFAQQMHDNLSDFLVGRRTFNAMKQRSVAEALARATMREAWRELPADRKHALTDAYFDPEADRDGWIRQLRGAKRDVSPLLADMRTPILYLLGERSTAGPISSTGVEFLKRLPGARVITVENGAHDLHIQQPEKVTELALAFWRELGLEA